MMRVGAYWKYSKGLYMMYYDDRTKRSNNNMICPNCKSEISDRDQYCPNCGTLSAEQRTDSGAQDSTWLSPGTILQKQYKIEKAVGGGGIKKYIATSLNAANKFLIEEKTCSFDEQFELLKAVHFLDIQKVHDHFTVKGREYIVHELPEGKSLFEIAAENWPDEDRAIDIAISLCNCVSEIHQAGYIHLNIEPGSIYILENRVRLFNFENLVCVGDSRASYFTLEGYSAPELLTKESNIDCRADIYSIGAVLYWMISKKTIALTANYLDMLEHISSPELVRIISSCTTSDPALRCSNLSELRGKLTDYQISSRRKSYFTSTLITDKGMVRCDNEDSCLVLDIERYTEEGLRSYGLYLVADGMGGQQAGEIASSTAVKAIQTTMLEILNAVEIPSYPDLIKRAIGKANLEIYHTAQSNRQYNSMGTTVTLGLRVDNELYIGHVGDSRAYLIRQGTIKQLTCDHSVVANLLKAEMITQAEAQDHPDRGKIYRSLGSSPDVVIDTYQQIGEDDKLKLESGDSLLFCTDGLTAHLTDEEILQEAEKHSNGADICNNLILLANRHGGSDNISIVLVKSRIN